MDVASSAAMSVMTARLRKARVNRHPGSNFSAEFCDFSEAESGLEGGSVSRTLGSMALGSLSDELGCVAIANQDQSSYQGVVKTGYQQLRPEDSYAS